ncbi:MAG: flagellar motor switch protein FliG [Spirochaetaceae bacterium]|jgi:flagellar motor switch protein FliG|nr:flagellar motor switch protein FliG [Spirochaetaceae bacterium]
MDFDSKRKLEAYKRNIRPGALATGGADASSRPKDTARATGGTVPIKEYDWRTKSESFAKIPYKFSGEGGLKGDVAGAAAPRQGDSSYRKAAKFLILIGPEQAAKVLANLDEKQVENISREIAGIRGITKEEASEIFAEFQGLLSSSLSYGGAAGGLEEARRVLHAAFGPEKGEEFLRRSVPEAKETSFGFLEDFSGEQIAALLRDELPAVGALILSRIDPKLAAKTLGSAGQEWRLETVRRIGHLGKTSPEVLEKTAAALREKARNMSVSVTNDIDGMGTLAAILKNSSVSFGDKIIRELSGEDPDLSGRLKERLYTIDDIVKAEDQPIERKLRDMSVRDIAILVKGRGDEFTEKILANISARRRAEVRDEISFIGPVSKRDSERAIKEFMDWFRRERESGQILMIGDELVE